MDTNILETTQGVAYHMTASTNNRIGDEINLKGVHMKFMVELNERYSDVTFRMFVVKKAKTRNGSPFYIARPSRSWQTSTKKWSSCSLHLPQPLETSMLRIPRVTVLSCWPHQVVTRQSWGSCLRLVQPCRRLC